MLTFTWKKIINSAFKYAELNNGYVEVIGATYSFDPYNDCNMSTNSSIIDADKLNAMYAWYLEGRRDDTSIIAKFPEYATRIDNGHTLFNSNYGWHMYTNGGLQHCIEVLAKDKNSRQAICILNSNDIMSDSSIDKLCTNSIQFVIRNNKLIAIIQMRSSNVITLLPYDVHMFSKFYKDAYTALSKIYKQLEAGKIIMQVGSLHFYLDDINKIKLQTSQTFYRYEIF